MTKKNSEQRADTEVTHVILAKVLGVSVRTLDRLVAANVIVPKVRGRGASQPNLYLLDVVVPAYIKHLTKAPTQSEERSARARRDKSQAELTELRISERRGDLVERDQVVLEGQNFCKALSAKIRALPRRLIQEGILTRELEARAATLVNEVLIEISSWKTLADVKKASDAA